MTACATSAAVLAALDAAEAAIKAARAELSGERALAQAASPSSIDENDGPVLPSTKTAADIFGVSDRTITRYCRNHACGVLQGGRWLPLEGRIRRYRTRLLSDGGR